jgi:hypothetical protein
MALPMGEDPRDLDPETGMFSLERYYARQREDIRATQDPPQVIQASPHVPVTRPFGEDIPIEGRLPEPPPPDPAIPHQEARTQAVQRALAPPPPPLVKKKVGTQ